MTTGRAAGGRLVTSSFSLSYLLALLTTFLLSACAAPTAEGLTATPVPPTNTPVATAIPTPTPIPSPPAVAELEAGTLVDIGGRRLFIQCTNLSAAGPAVIFESGLAADHRSWAQVQPVIAATARSCSYDRAGQGQSDPGPTPQDAALASADLSTLLRASNVPGPYLLVAHSFGGLFARRFTADNPDAVIGMILVDAVHEDWWDRALAVLPPAAPAESERLKGFRHFLTTEVADPAKNAEGVDIPGTVEQVRAGGDLGNRPLIILTAGISDVLAPGLPLEIETALVGLLQRELPAELAALSTDSTIVAVADSGHNLPQQRPDVIVLAIQAVLAAVGSR